MTIQLNSPTYCPYCGQTSLTLGSGQSEFTCASCHVRFSLQQLNNNDKHEYIILSIGKPKYDRDSKLVCWIKVGRKDISKPILFTYPLEKINSLSLKPSDIIFVNFSGGFTEKDDVIFASRPTDVQYIGSDLIELTVPITLEQLTFKDTELSAYIVYGKLTKEWVSTDYGGGYYIWHHTGETFPVKTTFPTSGASSISIRISNDLWTKFNTGIDLAFSHNKIKQSLPIDVQQSVAIEVVGKFRVIYNYDGTCRLQNTDDVFVVNRNLTSLRKVIEESELAKRWREVRKQIKEILTLKHIISASEVQAILDTVGYTASPEEAVKSLTWRSDYDEEYFTFLKELSGQDIIYFDEDSYYFQIGDKVVRETPKQGKASYCFLGKVTDVVTKLKALNLSRTELLEAKKQMPKEAIFFFRGRIIHANSEQWKRDILEFLNTGRAKLGSGED